MFSCTCHTEQILSSLARVVPMVTEYEQQPQQKQEVQGPWRSA